MRRRQRDTRTGDLFGTADLPVPPPMRAGVLDIDSEIRGGISDALACCAKPREMVAAEVAMLTGRPTFSKAMLDAYTAESRETHKVPAIFFFAIIHVTGAYDLLDRIVRRIGCRLYVGEDIAAAEEGRIQRQIDTLKQRQQALRRRHA